MWMNKKNFSGIRMVRPLKRIAVCLVAVGLLDGLAFCAPARAQDDPVSMGVSYGYAMTLGKSAHWGLEFTLGAGFAQYHYDAYRNASNGPKFRSGSDCYWGITRAGVTLSYRWTLLRKNRKH